jgi:hypothetical protein
MIVKLQLKEPSNEAEAEHLVHSNLLSMVMLAH